MLGTDPREMLTVLLEKCPACDTHYRTNAHLIVRDCGCSLTDKQVEMLLIYIYDHHKAEHVFH